MMLKWLCLIGLFCLPRLSYGQSIFLSLVSGELVKISGAGCTPTIIGTTIPFWDLAFSANGNLYGVAPSGFYLVDTVNANTTLISTGSYGSSLVGEPGGDLYMVNGNILQKVDVLTGNIINLGLLNYFAAGDITFIAGDLYMSTSSGELLKINISDPSQSVSVGNMNITNAFGLVNHIDGCNETLYAYTPNKEQFTINYNNGSSQYACTLPLAPTLGGIGGAAAPKEYLGAFADNSIFGVDINICDTIYTITLPNLQNVNYTWMDGSSSPVFQVNSSGTYWVEANILPDNCVYRDTILINFAEPFFIDFGSDTIICNDNSPITLIPQTDTGVTYLFSNGSTSPAISVNTSDTYWVTANNGGCIASDTIDVLYVDAEVDLGADLILCPEGNLKIIPQTGSLSYDWSDGSSGPFLEIHEPGSYQATININGCVDTDTISVIEQHINIDFSTNIHQGCAPLEIKLNSEVSLNTGSIQDSRWYANGLVFSLTPNPEHTFDNEGYFDIGLKITTVEGCDLYFEKSDFLEVYAEPKADFTLEALTTTANTPILLENNSIHDDMIYWTIEALNIYSTSSAFEISFPEIGTPDICLNIISSEGCKDSICRSITVHDNIRVYAPNVFTPGTGLNNRWVYYLQGHDLYDFKAQIFNRWGEIIWESQNPDIFWDGTYQNSIVEAGVYVWKMTVGSEINDRRQEFNGFITVLR